MPPQAIDHFDEYDMYGSSEIFLSDDREEDGLNATTPNAFLSNIRKKFQEGRDELNTSNLKMDQAVKLVSEKLQTAAVQLSDSAHEKFEQQQTKSKIFETKFPTSTMFQSKRRVVPFTDEVDTISVSDVSVSDTNNGVVDPKEEEPAQKPKDNDNNGMTEILLKSSSHHKRKNVNEIKVKQGSKLNFFRSSKTITKSKEQQQQQPDTKSTTARKRIEMKLAKAYFNEKVEQTSSYVKSAIADNHSSTNKIMNQVSKQWMKSGKNLEFLNVSKQIITKGDRRQHQEEQQQEQKEEEQQQPPNEGGWKSFLRKRTSDEIRIQKNQLQWERQIEKMEEQALGV